MSQPQSPWMVDVSNRFTVKRRQEGIRTLGPLSSQRQPHWSLLAAHSQELTVPIPGCLFLPVSFNAPTNSHVTTAACATQALGFLEYLGVQSWVWVGAILFCLFTLSKPQIPPLWNRGGGVYPQCSLRR